MVSCHIFFKGIGDVLEKASVVSRKIGPFGTTIETLYYLKMGTENLKLLAAQR